MHVHKFGRAGLMFNTDAWWCRSVKRILAGFRAAFRPRLLILVGLAAATAGYNAVAAEHLPAGDMAALLVGFLSYKAGLVVRCSSD